MLLFLIAPILAIMPLSFNSESFFSYPMPGYSLKWYEDFFFNDRWQSSLRMSIIVALATTCLATFLGTLAALGLARSNLPGRAALMAVLISPMIVPLIICGGRHVSVLFAAESRRDDVRIGARPYGACDALRRHHRDRDPVGLRPDIDAGRREPRRARRRRCSSRS